MVFNLVYYFMFLIISLIYSPYIIIQEDFNLLDTQEPKLIMLQTKLNPLFNEDCSYQGTILEDIMTMQTKRRIQNEISLSKGKKSYTINKEDIYICLKDENDEYYNDNMLIYVLLHEISHSVCNEIGHTEKFNKIFHAFIKKAVEMQIYDNNVPLIRNYCLYNDQKQK